MTIRRTTPDYPDHIRRPLSSLISAHNELLKRIAKAALTGGRITAGAWDRTARRVRACLNNLDAAAGAPVTDRYRKVLGKRDRVPSYRVPSLKLVMFELTEAMKVS